ncbi:MAG: HD domain-containing protein [Treponema sp.]|nr:HD domain-containing protein [Treponema sp.]
MLVLIYTMIALGVIIMVTNIYRYLLFLHSLHDVLSAGQSSGRFWKRFALVLLIFFLCGYIFIGVFSHPDLMMAGILFGGSIFVMIMLMLLFHLVHSVKENSLTMTETLIGMIESRDSNLNGHSRYVQNLTMLFFKYLPSELKADINPVSLEYAALMHDVGKLGIPESILNKPGRLDEEEWKLMREHPRLGVKFMESMQSFKHIMPWILYHHERIDGKGYYQLPGNEIPLAARIISICDTYSAITMRRSYKDAMPYEIALSIINDVAGSQLDADLVQIFSKIPRAELENCVPKNLAQ